MKSRKKNADEPVVVPTWHALKGRLRYDHAEGFGSLSYADVLLWIFNLFLVGTVLIYAPSINAFVGIVAAAVAIQVLLLKLSSFFKRRIASRKKKRKKRATMA